ncbi:hypothetical protein [Sphingomonas sp. Leaf4]|uniref:hypothetical protein n=1 Tax=Sphingomonas sp. Leaf4 TaxID=2876553 RepID=UPI001E29FBCC|nr:hypothetical protein [Sphingomonas sp. Leaf4]
MRLAAALPDADRLRLGKAGKSPERPFVGTAANAQFVTNSSGAEQRLRQLWSGYFYSIPQIEGTIEVRCINGARMQ